MRPTQILVNDDDLETRKVLRLVLEQQTGHAVTEAVSTEAALRLLAERCFDLLITEQPRSGVDGLELVTQVRRHSHLPIIVVSERNEIVERVRALRTGADDYILKPFDSSELLARVDALLRRSRQAAPGDLAGIVKVGDLAIDLTASVASFGPRKVRLTPTELRLLLRLARPPGEVRTREELAQAIWGEGPSASTGAINTYVADLRRKLESERDTPRVLETVRGTGYRLSLSR